VTYLVGLDIAQREDWTALGVLEEDTDRDLTLVALERIRHRPYPEIAQLVADTVAALPGAVLLVDVTGVGRPVTDQLDALGVRHIRVNIHGGNAVTRLDDGTLSIPKRDLIAALVVRFEARTIRIAAGLPHADTLEREASAFRTKLSASGHDTYNAREGEHDDLLLAVSLPVWWAGRRPPPAASASVDPGVNAYHADRGAFMAGFGRRRR
jgi:hypothetical protein